jgi:hypothetical protein
MDYMTSYAWTRVTRHDVISRRKTSILLANTVTDGCLQSSFNIFLTQLSDEAVYKVVECGVFRACAVSDPRHLWGLGTEDAGCVMGIFTVRLFFGVCHFVSCFMSCCFVLCSKCLQNSGNSAAVATFNLTKYWKQFGEIWCPRVLQYVTVGGRCDFGSC